MEKSTPHLSIKQIDNVIGQCGLKYTGGGTESWTSPGYRMRLYREGEQGHIAHIFFKHEVPDDSIAIARDILRSKPDYDVLPFHGATISKEYFVERSKNPEIFNSKALVKYAEESDRSSFEIYFGNHAITCRRAIYEKEIGSPSSDKPIPGNPPFNEGTLREAIEDVVYFDSMIDAIDQKISEANEFKEFSDDGRLSSDELDNIVKAAILAYK